VLWVGIILMLIQIRISMLMSRSGSVLASKRCQSTCGSWAQVLHILENKENILTFIFSHSRRLQREVVYLGWPIAPLLMSPNAGGGGVAESQPMSTCSCTQEPK
jgi:hypothetical protein